MRCNGSRKTGYKYLERYAEAGTAPLEGVLPRAKVAKDAAPIAYCRKIKTLATLAPFA